MLTALCTQAHLPDRKARLLLASSQESTSSVIMSRYMALANSMASLVRGLLMVTLPLSSTVDVPKDHRRAYRVMLESSVCANANPEGYPFGLSFLPARRTSSQLSGRSSPTSWNRSSRYVCGMVLA